MGRKWVQKSASVLATPMPDSSPIWRTQASYSEPRRGRVRGSARTHESLGQKARLVTAMNQCESRALGDHKDLRSRGRCGGQDCEAIRPLRGAHRLPNREGARDTRQIASALAVPPWRVIGRGTRTRDDSRFRRGDPGNKRRHGSRVTKDRYARGQA
jgi:hypothetical protein